ncbi:NAD(P)/FAD-dependent oxidoreductase [Cerasicoccus maritimus]|uniref:NAD(P)/FAD-dependent oxidoreductase n=1 Tax=Cerasicoccus maritimus TaxID=490089 RepID=UPI0028528539|nr:FAD-dependent oxidoreductase [Cerasicoccus maritimus]
MPDNPIDLLVIGAGIAGLLAARELTDKHGLRVAILDKSRGVGGRMATRRDGEATYDHGAQFFSATNPRFKAWVDHWLEQRVVKMWFDQFSDEPPMFRYAAFPSMTAVAKKLVEGLEIHRQTKVISAAHESGGWVLKTEVGNTFRAPKLLINAPVPQAMEILDAGGTQLKTDDDAFLRSIKYAKTIAAMVELETPSHLPNPGRLKLDPPEPVAWIADNQQKGVSGLPAVTIHSGHEFAEKYFDEPDEVRVPILVEAALPYLKAKVVSAKGHRWKFAHRLTEHNRDFFADPTLGLWMAGDSFHAPKVEGAAMSGLLAADSIAASA